jgi:hypothetical protein
VNGPIYAVVGPTAAGKTKAAFELARRLYRQLANPAFNAKLSKYVRLPYREDWYGRDPFSYIKSNMEIPDNFNIEGGAVV